MSNLYRFPALILACTIPLAWTGSSNAAPYTNFPAAADGFNQELYATAPSFMGGIAFAPDGDVLVDGCAFSSSALIRFDMQSTVIVNGTTVHPQAAGSPLPSNAGCGLTNHPDGSLYSNTSSGVTNLSASTGTELRPPFGPAGNALRITFDPQTGNLVYVGSDGTIHWVNALFTATGVFSSVTTGNFVDGIYFDPTGNYLFMANRSPSYQLTIVDRTGTLVQHVPMTSEPDGIAFHGGTPEFVLTSNIDGTLVRFDFAGGDFTQVPTQTLFASGGFRGDLSQVGPDGCLYLTQAGARYDNGVETGDNSIVRICPDFQPPIAVVDLSPESDVNPVNTPHTVTATIRTPAGGSIAGALVTFAVISGPNTGTGGTCSANADCTTDANGQVSFTYLGDGGVGIDVIQASYDAGGTIFTDTAQKEWMGQSGGGDAAFDIHPGSCRNPLSMNRHGVVPAAILGSADFDVNQINLSSILLGGVIEPKRYSWEDVASPDDGLDECQCGGDPDGFTDLTLKFSAQAILTLLGPVVKNQVVTLTVTGELLDGTPFSATDCMVIVGGGHAQEGVFLAPGSAPGDRIQEVVYSLPQPANVKLDLFSISGRLVRSLVRGVESSGDHLATWDATNLPTGIYFYRLEVDGQLETRKVVLNH